jgi:hypothetical protein
MRELPAITRLFKSKIRAALRARECRALIVAIHVELAASIRSGDRNAFERPLCAGDQLIMF